MRRPDVTSTDLPTGHAPPSNRCPERPPSRLLCQLSRVSGSFHPGRPHPRRAGRCPALGSGRVSATGIGEATRRCPALGSGPLRKGKTLAPHHPCFDGGSCDGGRGEGGVTGRGEGGGGGGRGEGGVTGRGVTSEVGGRGEGGVPADRAGALDWDGGTGGGDGLAALGAAAGAALDGGVAARSAVRAQRKPSVAARHLGPAVCRTTKSELPSSLSQLPPRSAAHSDPRSSASVHSRTLLRRSSTPYSLWSPGEVPTAQVPG